MNTDQQSRSQTRVLRVFFACFAPSQVKVQPRIHREAAKISRRKILSCQQRIFGLSSTDLRSSVFVCGFILCSLYGLVSLSHCETLLAVIVSSPPRVGLGNRIFLYRTADLPGWLQLNSWRHPLRENHEEV